MRRMIRGRTGFAKRQTSLFAWLAAALAATIPNLSQAATLMDLNGGLTSATTTISGTYALVSKLCLAIGTIVGLTGGIRVNS